MSLYVTRTAFDRDKSIAIVAGFLAGVETRSLALVAGGVFLLIMVASVIDAQEPTLGFILAPSAGTFGFIITGILRAYSRKHPPIMVDPNGIVHHRYLRTRFFTWTDIAEISQNFRRRDIGFTVHMRSGHKERFSLYYLPWRDRDRLFFILHALAQEKGVVWSITEPARWHDEPVSW